MKKFLILLIVLGSTAVFAQTATEEAIILNQELQFLENSVNDIQAASVATDGESSRNRALNTRSLENTYFGESEDSEQDSVSTRSAAPKRRRD